MRQSAVRGKTGKKGRGRTTEKGRSALRSGKTTEDKTMNRKKTREPAVETSSFETDLSTVKIMIVDGEIYDCPERRGHED